MKKSQVKCDAKISPIVSLFVDNYGQLSHLSPYCIFKATVTVDTNLILPLLILTPASKSYVECLSENSSAPRLVYGGGEGEVSSEMYRNVLENQLPTLLEHLMS